MKKEKSVKSKRFSLGAKLGQVWQHWTRPLTLMLAPHDEGKVISFRVSIFSLWVFGLSLIAIFFIAIIFSTSSYRRGAEVNALTASIGTMMDESERIRGAVEHLPAISEILGDTVKSISDSSSLDLSLPTTHSYTESGDLTNSTISSKNPYGHQSSEIEKIEQSMKVIEDSIPVIATLGEILDTQKQFLAEMPTSWPVIGNRGYVTMLFGWGRDPFTDGRQYHTGVDIANPLGTPILAAADGVVVKTSFNAGGYGNVVLVRHGYGFYTRYAHMQRYIVTEGQKIKQGEQIGLMGATGRATGSHVHFEVLLGTEMKDPMVYLSIMDPSLVRYIRDRG